jgi:cytochrome c oxidase subunit 4
MSEHGHEGGETKFYLKIWFWLLALTGVEVVLAYIQLSLIAMLVILLGLSIIKATLIISYFMHLRFERLSLFLTLFPALILCIVLLFISFPDSARLHDLRWP